MQLSQFSDHYPDFLLTLAQQGKSPHTQAAYRRDLEQLAGFFADLPPQETVSRKHFTAALKKLSQKQIGERSMARKLSAWRQYCAWLVRHGKMETDPTELLKAPKAPQRLPKALEQELINRLLDQPQSDTPPDRRDHALFELMYGSGLRVSEVVSLNLNDVLLNEGWVSVSGKGGKQRRVPLTAKSIQAIEAYLPHRPAAEGETALFTNRYGRRLGVRQIQNRLRDWALAQGSPQHISPHMLRHSYASHILQSAHNIRAVQELLGHSSLSATQIYTKLDFDHLSKVYDDAHPRAKRRPK